MKSEKRAKVLPAKWEDVSYPAAVLTPSRHGQSTSLPATTSEQHLGPSGQRRLEACDKNHSVKFMIVKTTRITLVQDPCESVKSKHAATGKACPESTPRLCKVSTQTAEVSQVATWNQRFGMWWSQDFPEARDIARFPDSTAITSEIWDQSWNFQGSSC